MSTLEQITLKRLNERLDDLGTCMLTMTALRKHLCESEIKHRRFGYSNPFECNQYMKERVYIDGFLEYIFSEIEYYFKLRDESQTKLDQELKKSEKDEKNEKLDQKSKKSKKGRCFSCFKICS